MDLSSSAEPPASSSEPAAGWLAWLAAFAASLVISGSVLFAFVVVMDPFSTGRLTPLTRIDMATTNRLYADAGRVRDPSFDSAVFGDSTSVRIEPARLDEMTGRRFVMLGIEGTFWPEHLYLLRRFDRLHRDRPGALVVVVSDPWCIPTPRGGYEVPRWLYEGTTLEYLAGITSLDAVSASFQRLLIVLGLDQQGARRDGYDAAPWLPPGRDRMMREMQTMSPPTDGPDPQLPFPSLDALDRDIAGLAPGHSVLMVFPPVYRMHLPQPGSTADQRFAACKARAHAVAAAHPHTAVLDLRVDAPKVGDPNNFVDEFHFKDLIAHDVEAAIAARLNALFAAAP